jgi:hypothetical protein
MGIESPFYKGNAGGDLFVPQRGKPHHRPTDKDSRDGIDAYLCADSARQVFRGAQILCHAALTEEFMDSISFIGPGDVLSVLSANCLLRSI